MIVVSGKWLMWEQCYDFVGGWQYLQSLYFFHLSGFVGDVGPVLTRAQSSIPVHTELVLFPLRCFSAGTPQ